MTLHQLDVFEQADMRIKSNVHHYEQLCQRCGARVPRLLFCRECLWFFGEDEEKRAA
jgi:hypothetical protein